MKRRHFLTVVGASTGVTAVPVSAETDQRLQTIGQSFFESLQQYSEDDRGVLLRECTNALCVEDKISEEETDEIVEDVDDINHHIRRIRFGIRVLNEHNISTAIDESMVTKVEQRAGNATRFVPLVGSFNNLQAAACAVGPEPDAEDAEQFLYACLAFGLEVGLWYSTVPYQMAWRGTRFASNRTLLRYANHGCNGCIAFAMSELHWALRSIPYATVSEDRVEEFVFNEIERLRTVAQNEEYEVDVEFSREEITELVGPSLESVGGGGAVAAPPSGQSTGLPDEYLIFGLISSLATLYIVSKD